MEEYLDIDSVKMTFCTWAFLFLKQKGISLVHHYRKYDDFLVFENSDKTKKYFVYFTPNDTFSGYYITYSHNSPGQLIGTTTQNSLFISSQHTTTKDEETEVENVKKFFDSFPL